MKQVLIALTLLALLAGCSAEDTSKTGEPSTKAAVAQDPETVELKAGESVEVPALAASIAFDTVLEDSRCPVDVECVWEGNAKVGLRLVSDESSAPFELNSSQQGGETMFAHAGYSVTIDSVDPKPKSTEAIDPALYVLTLKIQKQ